MMMQLKMEMFALSNSDHTRVLQNIISRAESEKCAQIAVNSSLMGFQAFKQLKPILINDHLRLKILKNT